MLPDFDRRGNLPPDIHFVSWPAVCRRYGHGARRQLLLAGLKEALIALSTAGCGLMYLDGSFVTAKSEPGDFDACWSVNDVDAGRLDPIFLDFSNGRAAQKARFAGELFPPRSRKGRAAKRSSTSSRPTGRPACPRASSQSPST